jgi:acid phosphatase type 7
VLRRAGKRRPLLWIAAAMCLALVAEPASATTRTLVPTRQKAGWAQFKLSKIRPADIKLAFLRVGNKERALKLSIVRKGARLGVLKVNLPKVARKKGAAKRKKPRVRLRIVLLDHVAGPPTGSTGGGGGGGGGEPPPPVDPFPGNGSPVVAAAGDIACDPNPANEPDYNNGNGTATNCRHKYTAPLLAGADRVLALGDQSYGYANAYETSYAPTWGVYQSITRPITGDHEYDSDAPGSHNITRYANYFGAVAGEAGKFYYSFDVGSWHVVALNSNCAQVACDALSPQVAWLQADLTASSAQCTLVYWHHPHFTDGPHVPDEEGSTLPFWQAATAANADVILHGNDHNYQRWPRINAAGTVTPTGIRQFVVGTGGKSHTTPTGTGAEVRNNNTFGVLKLRLRSGAYDWQFIPEPGQTFTDSGTDTCS